PRALRLRRRRGAVGRIARPCCSHFLFWGNRPRFDRGGGGCRLVRAATEGAPATAGPRGRPLAGRASRPGPRPGGRAGGGVASGTGQRPVARAGAGSGAGWGGGSARIPRRVAVEKLKYFVQARSSVFGCWSVGRGRRNQGNAIRSTRCARWQEQRRGKGAGG